MRRVLLLAVLPLLVSAQEQPSSSIPAETLWLRITATAGKHRLSLVLAGFSSPENTTPEVAEQLEQVQSVFEADLRFSLHFTFQEPESGIVFDYETGSRKVDLEGWASTGAEILICGGLVPQASGPTLELRLYDLNSSRRIAAKSYPFQKPWRWMAHGMADDVIELLTGEEGVSRTCIGFTRALGQGHKELAKVDYDGTGLVRITSSGGVKLFPDWSPTGSDIAYCAYGKRSLNICRCDIAGGNRMTVSERAGLNTTPAWSPDGRTIAAALSFEGSSDIYLMNAAGQKLRRLTRSGGIDISPSWSPSGRQLAFTSDRTGTPQVYIINADGTDLHRLTFEGSYNTSPSWSPRGDLIAFVQRQPGGSNQVCVTNLQGETYMRLTSRGNNEDPCWSADGLHLAFASNRTGIYEIYTMAWNGAGQTRITRTGGATSPTWSPVLR